MGVGFSIERSVEVLVRTPGVLRAVLGGIDDSWARSGYGEGTFSPFDVVGHLIHGEKTDWMVRVRWILERDEAEAFEPFDRYAMFEECAGRTVGELLDEFAVLRERNVGELRAMELTDDDLARRGRHPALGGVTLGELVAAWTVHDLHHVAQVCKAMAHQYRGDVGAWRAYLGILPGDAG